MSPTNDNAEETAQALVAFPSVRGCMMLEDKNIDSIQNLGPSIFQQALLQLTALVLDIAQVSTSSCILNVLTPYMNK